MAQDTLLSRLRELQRLTRVKEAVDSSQGKRDTSLLERDFLSFAGYVPHRSLTVHLPQLYALDAEQHTQLQQSFIAIRKEMSILPNAIDISGSSDPLEPASHVVILSPNQLNADHITSLNSYLNPLLEKVYSDAALLLRDFTIHESIIGTVQMKRGDLLLSEAHIFPERFLPGPYTLSTLLDTPTGTIRKFREISSAFAIEKKNDSEKNNGLNNKLQKLLLDKEKLTKITSLALNLRKKIGSLSRYTCPENQEISVETNTCIVRTLEGTNYYLYIPDQHKNIVISFRKDEFKSKSHQHLLELNGKSYENTLAKLVELGVYEPSSAVLDDRISHLEHLYEQASRGAGTSLREEHTEFMSLLDSLKSARTYFQEVVNKEKRKEYASRISPELLEFMICPKIDEPLVHELLPRLSWNRTIRTYHNVRKFIHFFNQGDTSKKKEMLHNLFANMIFQHQQNNTVNTYLYEHYKQFCVDEGVQFKMI